MHRLPLLLAAGLILLTAGCADDSDQARNVAVIGDSPPTLADPAAGPLTLPQQVMMENVAQGLVRFDARGQIDSGLAERWNVSDDGLSYIFRLQSAKWPDGRPIHARDIARLLSRQLRPASRNPARDTLGAVQDVVAMTDRVIQIQLSAPRPNLLQLLAQPELGLTREGLGTGPFQPDSQSKAKGVVRLVHVEPVADEPERRDLVNLYSARARAAIAGFTDGRSDLVLGGTFDDLPLVPRANLPRGALRFDPVAGLFGLVPARRGGPLANPELRGLLNRAIDRDALVAALNVPGLVGRATLLQAGLDGTGVPAQPAWSAIPIEQRRAQLAAESRGLSKGKPVTLAIALPGGPGGAILFNRLAADWGAVGISLVRASAGAPADLRLIDAVAPSSSPAWFVRAFRCEAMPICSAEADTEMDSARAATVADQRSALILDADRRIEEQTLFLPLAAPVRWSLVGKRVEGFAENIMARHPLTGLGERLNREGQ